MLVGQTCTQCCCHMVHPVGQAGSPWSHRTYYYTRHPDAHELWQLSKEHAARVAAGDRRSGTEADSADCARHSNMGDASSFSASSSDAIAAGVAVAKSSVANMRRRNGVNVPSGGSTGSSNGDGSTGNGSTGNGTSTSSGSAAKHSSSLPSGVMTLWVSDNLFEGGTGCHPWEAGFRLAEFVMSNPELFAGKQHSNMIMAQPASDGVRQYGHCLKSAVAAVHVHTVQPHKPAWVKPVDLGTAPAAPPCSIAAAPLPCMPC